MDERVYERRAAILRAVVEEYVETAQPVGSGSVAHRGGMGSPATVRNDMVALEQEGFLYQPHTSAGRVPTDRGYRFFVDTVVAPGELAPLQRQAVREVFARAHGALEETLRDASRLLARLTDYAAVVVGPPHEAATIRSVQLVDLGSRTALVVAVLSNGSVEKGFLELSHEVGEDRLAAAGASLAACLQGATLASLPDPRPTGDPAVDALVSAALEALRISHGAEVEPVFVGGTSSVAASFAAVETVRGVLALLEQQYAVVGLLQHVLERGRDDRPSVAIGAEHGVVDLADCAVVVAPYSVEGEPAGSVAVLGPTRMHYPETLAAVAAVSSRLTRWLAAN
ncbi:MAG: heat-inducible transcription repressor HrcA [Acidimicrobiales bacterium]|jgi:heat-inducible transcriptional repressor|nr:heat-inducible transcription repressor HrcA [Acidimicrobiales bacterium]